MPPRGTFRLVAYDEGGVRVTEAPDRRQKSHRLVCLIADNGGKLAIWGGLFAKPNIDAVLAAGLPCTVECEYREPAEWAVSRYQHTHWVAQDYDLRVLG